MNGDARQIRVAHVVEALEVGGLEKLIVEFARHSDRARFATRVVTLDAPGRLAPEVEAIGWPVDALHARPGLKPSAVIRLARLFRRERIDVVHTHSEGPLLYGAAAARLARVPRVIHTRHHGPDLGSTPRQLLLMRAATRWVARSAPNRGSTTSGQVPGRGRVRPSPRLLFATRGPRRKPLDPCRRRNGTRLATG